MKDKLHGWMETVGIAVDVIGVLVILIGIVLATWHLIRCHSHRDRPFSRYRQDLGRAILLGLEFLIAGDIIRSVAVSPSIENMLTLGAIVLIRTFLSMSLEVELEGSWPWQRKGSGKENSLQEPTSPLA